MRYPVFGAEHENAKSMDVPTRATLVPLLSWEPVKAPFAAI